MLNFVFIKPRGGVMIFLKLASLIKKIYQWQLKYISSSYRIKGAIIDVEIDITGPRFTISRLGLPDKG